jgi:transcriptional regulator of acetoin/glycerol metabolism
VLRRAAPELAGQEATLIVSDSEGTVVRVTGDRTVLRMLERAGAAPGDALRESSAGTNGLGTALAEATGVTVVGGEHFIEAFQPFACTGFPIRGPAGEVLGVINLTTRAIHYRPETPQFVAGLANEVEQILREELACGRRTLLEGFCRFSESAPDACVVAVDERGRVLANRVAVGVIAPLLNEIVSALLESRADRPLEWSDLLTLPTGQQLRVVASATSDDVSGNGIVAYLKPTRRSKRARADGASHLPPGTVGYSPLFLRTVDELRSAIQGGGTVILTGESGTGKSHLAAAIMRERFPNASMIQSTDVAAANAPFAQATVIDDLHRLDQKAQESIWTRVARQTTGAVLLVVAEDWRKLSPSWRRASAHTVTIPALRDRPEDIIPLSRHFLELSKQPRTLTRQAERALRNYDWPGNIPELRRTIEAAAGSARGWTIEVADLPDEIGAANAWGELTQWERVEVAALRKALAESGGNRLEAARRLGISRATRYRKMSRYRLA